MDDFCDSQATPTGAREIAVREQKSDIDAPAEPVPPNMTKTATTSQEPEMEEKDEEDGDEDEYEDDEEYGDEDEEVLDGCSMGSSISIEEGLDEEALDKIRRMPVAIPDYITHLADLPDYIYEPLEYPEASTRVLALFPGAQNSPIRVAIYVMPFERPFPFAALSYFWGDASVKTEVEVRSSEENSYTEGIQNSTLSISEKMERCYPVRHKLRIHSSQVEALQGVRHKDEGSMVWADGICINQGDRMEKNYQVKSLGKIYSIASRTVDWLGEEAEEACRTMDLADLPDYTYERLEHPETSTRILVLFPGAEDSPIRIAIMTMDFSKPPKYVALSYCWGDASVKTEVELRSINRYSDNEVSEEVPTSEFMEKMFPQRRKLKIHTSLFVALKRLRQTETTSTIWADGICINQTGDWEEKGLQVKTMDKIYSLAGNTTIWLGEAADDSDLAMALIDEWTNTGKLVMAAWRDQHPGFSEQDVHAYWETKYEEDLQHRFWQKTHTDEWTQNWEAFFELLARPWFQRRWVIQEAVLAESHVLRCGDQMASWKSLLKICFFRLTERTEPPLLTPITREQHRFMHVVKSFDMCPHSKYPLLHLCAGFDDSWATDPRDIIYSLLSLASNENLNISPNYQASNTGTKVFLEVFQHIVQRTQSLDIVCCSNHFLPRLVSTWLPCFGPGVRACCGSAIPGRNRRVSGMDCSEYSPLFMDDEIRYRASLSEAPCYRIEIPGDSNPKNAERAILIASGYLYDPISWAGEDRYSPCKVPGYRSRQSMETGSATRTTTQEASLSFWMSQVRDENFVPSSEHRSWSEIRWLRPEILAEIQASKEWEAMGQYSCYSSRENCSGNYLFMTSAGVGFTRCLVTEGDVICVLLGCSHPIILRPWPNVENPEGYFFVSHCYFEGIMNGEFMESCLKDNTPLQEFRIH